MKKKSLLLLVFILLVSFSFMGISKAGAMGSLDCGNDVTLSDGSVSRTCELKFSIVQKNEKLNVIDLDLELANFYVKDITLKSNWTLNAVTPNSKYTFTYSHSNLPIGDYEVATIVFYKINPHLVDRESCHIEYSIDYDYINRSCFYDTNHNIYYGPNGEPIEKLQFQKECETNICKKLADGTFYGPTGKEVSEATYNKECLKTTCKKEITCDDEEKCLTRYENSNYTLQDGERVSKYYANTGLETTKELFEYECLPHYCEKLPVPGRTCPAKVNYCYDNGETVYFDEKGQETSLENYDINCITHKCEIVHGTYFGLSGLKVTKINYEKECLTHTCEILDDNTHYGKNGVIVDSLTYQKECETIICKKLADGTYFGKSGEMVSEDVYKAECEKVNICIQTSDGTYYGKDGSKVSASEFASECGSNICKKAGDGKYYGKNGEEISEIEYQKECETNICKKLTDGTYFGKSGKMVSEDVYKAECEKINICVKSNDVYYGRDGREIDKTQYEIECGNNVCKQTSDGKYYDLNGEAVDATTYSIECLPHKCEKVGNTYFNDKGEITTEEDYNKCCGTLEKSPQTGGMNFSLTCLLILMLVGIISFINIKKRNKLF